MSRSTTQAGGAAPPVHVFSHEAVPAGLVTSIRKVCAPKGSEPTYLQDGWGDSYCHVTKSDVTYQ